MSTGPHDDELKCTQATLRADPIWFNMRSAERSFLKGETMASVANDPRGFRRVLFIGLDGKRRTIRLGKVSEKIADAVARHIENILSAALHPPLAKETAAWLADQPDRFHAKLVKAGLVEPRKATGNDDQQSLGPFLDSYIAKRVDAKSTTRLVFGRARKHLIEFFGAGRRLSDVTQGAAEDFALYLTGKEIGKTAKRLMAEATVRKMCGVARQFFESAVKHRLIPANPFDADGIKTTVRGNADKFRFITADDAEAVIKACPDAQWRLIVALSRWGGLRCPSEHLALTLDHIDWENNRLIVPQPKVAHHGTPQRVIPIFPELRPYLEEVFDAAPSKTVWLITRYRDSASNLRTQFERIIKRAGLTPWPRLFHNLRATRQTELSDRFPQHVVCQWLGNSEQVASRHYLNVTDAHFHAALTPIPKAAQKAAQCAPELRRIDAHGGPGNKKTPCFQGVLVAGMDDTGLEPVTSTMSTWRSNQLS